MPQNDSDPQATSKRVFQRPLGDSELSYFLPSREDGVNDMYLHLGFRASNAIVNRYRLALAWAILRIRHPLLASRVLAAPGNYEEISFQYHPPSSPSEALQDASSSLEISQGTAETLILSFLNGPRTLSNNRLSYLILSSPGFNGLPTPPPTPVRGVETESLQEFDLLICATHFLGDGMALHMLANDLFSLLASSENRMDDSDLYKLLMKEWRTYWGESSEVSTVDQVLPPALESRLPKPISAFQRIAQKLEFDASQDRVLGSHIFPRQEKPKRHTTIVPTTPFDRHETSKILAYCKGENVTVGHLIFAVCNTAWIKVGKPDQRSPMMMYSALNLRPYLPLPLDRRSSPPSLSDSYWFLAVGYFNVVLPSFPARSACHRARLVKEQCIAASKSQLLLSRTRCMAHERSVKAKKFAAIDDDEAKMEAPEDSPITVVEMVKSNTRLIKKPPSVALLGLSLLGNLDGIYKHDAYPSVILSTLTTGSRQRPGGLLVFGYTFAGRLWLSIGYDKEAYNDQVENWWDEVVRQMKEIGRL